MYTWSLLIETSIHSFVCSESVIMIDFLLIDVEILANIGIHEKSAPDGIDLPRRLDDEYGLVVHNLLETTNAVAKFNAICRDPNKEVTNYHTRYMVAYQTCLANNKQQHTLTHCPAAPRLLYLRYRHGRRDHVTQHCQVQCLQHPGGPP
eukprot:CAMPEP_0204629366 /NCGR_PEP_ID=MMETSP0717-20131115/18083_1 /ASSEMBLY_ACC=CAM_ASM_000666 /TAXON_ID=230516 /ORGANISM="Chaetoceros curvisetus" /LENGTH=148 /DNA_ID=CAMNT_0051646291 /DNA_START=375 /DNA_END=821 /DNA_ORIENTATION=+